VEYTFINKQTLTSSLEYKKAIEDAKNIVSAITGMFNTVKGNEFIPPSLEVSTTDELRKYKSLLDEGIITQDDFDAKKKQLMGL
jgi:hypothetical protein